MSKPEPLLLQVGEVFVFPSSGGKSLNPYLRDPYVSWTQDGWSAAVMAEAELFFGYLAWYRPIVSQQSWAEKPTLEAVLVSPDWNLEHAATCSKKHYQKLGIEKLGQVPLSSEWREHLSEDFVTGKQAALDDISISNRLEAMPGDSFGRLTREQLWL